MLKELLEKRVPLWMPLGLVLALVALPLWLTGDSEGVTISDEEVPALGIKQLITGVKRELRETERERLEQDQAALFRLKNFDLEVNFAIRRRARGQAGVDYELIAVTGETEVAVERLHKITLHLEAVESVADSIRASERPPSFDTAGVREHDPPPPDENEP